MIAIVNVGHPADTDPQGWRNYEVRINQEVICTFEHRRSDGLSACLRRAAEAVGMRNYTLSLGSEPRDWWNEP